MLSAALCLLVMAPGPPCEAEDYSQMLVSCMLMASGPWQPSEDSLQKQVYVYVVKALTKENLLRWNISKCEIFIFSCDRSIMINLPLICTCVM